MKRVNYVLILFASVLISAVTLVVFKEQIFKHRDQIVYSDWSKCDSNGYAFAENEVISVAGDPCIFFFSDQKTDKVEVDVQLISNPELLWNREFYGEEVIYAELFWANEQGEMTAENSIPFKIEPGKKSYMMDVDCPANTMFRLDIGDGVDVNFKAYSLVFSTYEEYTDKEKQIAVVLMFFLVFISITLGYRFCIKKDS
ncbi:MAG: hypothetical protein K5769_04990 [Pseudobutyrivibrio sp.]|nr:hypothetical protein [Pseudobutyrivibrio sp.]